MKRVSAAVPVITIDGPSGTGKGTIARLLKSWLGWHLLDSGALYRIVGYAAAQRGVDLDEADALSALAQGLDIEFLDAGGEEVIITQPHLIEEAMRGEQGTHIVP